MQYTDVKCCFLYSEKKKIVVAAKENKLGYEKDIASCLHQWVWSDSSIPLLQIISDEKSQDSWDDNEDIKFIFAKNFDFITIGIVAHVNKSGWVSLDIFYNLFQNAMALYLVKYFKASKKKEAEEVGVTPKFENELLSLIFNRSAEVVTTYTRVWQIRSSQEERWRALDKNIESKAWVVLLGANKDTLNHFVQYWLYGNASSFLIASHNEALSPVSRDKSVTETDFEVKMLKLKTLQYYHMWIHMLHVDRDDDQSIQTSLKQYGNIVRTMSEDKDWRNSKPQPPIFLVVSDNADSKFFADCRRQIESWQMRNQQLFDVSASLLVMSVSFAITKDITTLQALSVDQRNMESLLCQVVEGDEATFQSFIEALLNQLAPFWTVQRQYNERYSLMDSLRAKLSQRKSLISGRKVAPEEIWSESTAINIDAVPLPSKVFLYLDDDEGGEYDEDDRDKEKEKEEESEEEATAILSKSIKVAPPPPPPSLLPPLPPKEIQISYEHLEDLVSPLSTKMSTHTALIQSPQSTDMLATGAKKSVHSKMEKSITDNIFADLENGFYLVCLYPLIMAMSICVTLPSCYLLLIFRMNKVEMDHKGVSRRQAVIEAETRQKRCQRVLWQILRSGLMFTYLVAVPLIITTIILPMAHFRNTIAIAVISTYIFSILLLQAFGTYRAFQSYSQRLQIHPYHQHQGGPTKSFLWNIGTIIALAFLCYEVYQLAVFASYTMSTSSSSSSSIDTSSSSTKAYQHLNG
ncbi:hypothetical protein RFI_01267 [Reticulomyxa filosa]|uniref:Uncharacterized protein n=1 Tax=Reticulomyxa filosa TaxID=46433 RepID=X6PC95_RETFI|nr:hypothetical protein RFI_01267 [Reticulomyxa filosa]|eukprot:ETO35796.1 hypothetical protein RFI_01267 [Reticulomyxa filosa]